MSCGAILPISRLPRCMATSSVDRKSTRLNSSHVEISYAVFCLKKKKQDGDRIRPDPPITSACAAAPCPSTDAAAVNADPAYAPHPHVAPPTASHVALFRPVHPR